jgi:hypothetical protein
MRIREDDRNMVLLGTVTLISAAIAGLAWAIDPAPAPASATARRPAYAANQTDVRVVGTPFIPNTNPRER